MHKATILLYGIMICYFGHAQEAGIETGETGGTTDWKIEMLGSVATGSKTPFWNVSNRYGVVPLEAGNGYLRVAVTHEHKLGNNFYVNLGTDMIASSHHYRNVFLQQGFAEVGYKILLLSIGVKENYISLFDRDISSGDMVQSANARPIPEIRLAVPQFTVIPYTHGWLQFRGDFALGKSYDTDYLKYKHNKDAYYIRDVLWHHKSLHIRLSDTRNGFPLSLIIGLRHRAQWGGVSNNPVIGVQPHSWKDFVRIVLSRSGGADATPGDIINVLGNHVGSYDIKAGYVARNGFAAFVYKQHFFDDASGMEWYNYPDGLYGLQVNIPHFALLNSLVIEFLNTCHQSGPFHKIDFDHDKYPGFGGGGDDYYNHAGNYSTGLSYYSRSIGTPLIKSPEYNSSGWLGFENNRVQALHFGVKGYLSSIIAYRALVTSINGWGTHGRPLLKKSTGVMTGAGLTFYHPRLNGWQLKLDAATDTGDMFGKGTGLNLTIIKNGSY